MNLEIPIESHPLKPFIPEGAQILFLGSFPPQKKRWSMNFFYPNIQNDMWRIFGLIFHQEKNFFYDEPSKKFKQPMIESFLREKGIAIFDTATRVRRLKDNASDLFLEIVEPTDLHQLLSAMPLCKAIVTTGKRAAEVAANQFGVETMGVGECVCIEVPPIHIYRMPSSSRSYPLALDKKAAIYRAMFEKENLL